MFLSCWKYNYFIDAESFQEIAEPLHDLKDGIMAVESSISFQQVLSALLSIGNVLNGGAVRLLNIISMHAIIVKFIVLFCQS